MSTNKNTKTPGDPHYQEEAERYTNPVPSRNFILAFLNEYGPASLKQVTDGLSVTGERDLDAMRKRVNAMLRDGQIREGKKNKLEAVAEMALVSGRVIGHPDGYGFLSSDELEDDVFLTRHTMRSVLHGDRITVSVRQNRRNGKLEGRLVKVLERRSERLVGRIVQTKPVCILEPDDRRIAQPLYLTNCKDYAAQKGTYVTALIEHFPTEDEYMEGRIISALGSTEDPRVISDIALTNNDIPTERSQAAKKQAEKLAKTEIKVEPGREDLRDLAMITIDGEDARDFDDAVYCQKTESGWHLRVAIADVSHYVEKGSPLDKESADRGNSVYLPDRVVPMLPEVLSNGLCSLRPDEDRLALTCSMQIDADGEIQDYRFDNTLILSKRRFTYTEVAQIFSGDLGTEDEPNEVVISLKALREVAECMRNRRFKAGSVDLDIQETRIVLNEEGDVDSVVPVERTEAHRLIEECMLAANICAARIIEENDLPGVYRVHEQPSEEKITDLRSFLGELGLSLGGGNQPGAEDYMKVVRQTHDRPDAHMIHTVILRSLSQARYQTVNVGHFALGFDDYTHFTSPIRRYPDLLVHRIIKQIIKHGKPTYPDVKVLEEHAEHCSMTERRADEAVYEVIRKLKARYLQQHVGDEFTGVVISVTAFGLFIELADVFVEGLLHVSSLGDDYYVHDPIHHRLMGERQRKSYHIGDRLQVRVARVDSDEGKVDLELAQLPAKSKKAKGKRKR